MRKVLIVTLGLASTVATANASPTRYVEVNPCAAPVVQCRKDAGGPIGSTAQNACSYSYNACITRWAQDKATRAQTAKQQTQDYLNGTRGGSSKTSASGSGTPVQPNNILHTGVKQRQER